MEARRLLRVPAIDQELTVNLIPNADCEIVGERSAPIRLSLEQLRVLIHGLKAAQDEMERML
jgi:hypothetical protein